jgi:SPP1 family predicted phage head-tail adaptor
MAKPGRMDKLITIQQWEADSPAQDAYGAPSGTWETYVERWAEKIDRGGREFLTGGVVYEATCVFKIRYTSGLNTKMRISYDSEYYDIISIVELGRQDTQEIIAKVQP